MPRFSSARALSLVAAVVLAALAGLPFVVWIPGGHEADWLGPVAADWLNGSMIVIGGGLLLAILSRKLPVLWRAGPLARLSAAVDAHPIRAALVVAAAAGLVYGVVAWTVLSARPLLIDEIVQTFQARILAEGRLWRAAAEHPEFYSSMHVIDAGGRVYGQFPTGGPAMLMLGTLIGAEWLVNPLAGAVSVLLFWAFVRHADERPGVRLGAGLLFAFAPFAIFMAGSHMNHVTTLLWLLVATVGLARATDGEERRVGAAFATGLGLGVAATIRPVDALAFAVPAGLWLLARALRTPARTRELLASGVGLAIPVAGLLAANTLTTGEPFLFGYTVLWGSTHDLGFHAAPWGDVHTPLRGLELINLYLLRLHTYLFEFPVPSLVPAILALALARRLSPLDRYLMAASAILVTCYFAYWHDGFYLGPRFMYPLLPVLALWTARLPALLDLRWGRGLGYRTAAYGFLIAVVLAAAFNIPIRARTYAGGMLSPRWDVDRAAERAGVESALVLVRESWGAQLLARMWALGVSRSDAEFFYRAVDRCVLEHQIGALEREAASVKEITSRLQALTVDEDRLVKVTTSTDPTARHLPGVEYDALCRLRMVEEEGHGFTVFPPLLLAQGDNIYARDLHARDSILLRQYPDRLVYLLRPTSFRVGAEPIFHRVHSDSLWRAWRASPDERSEASQ